jgi:hypothetical protein
LLSFCELKDLCSLTAIVCPCDVFEHDTTLEKRALGNHVLKDAIYLKN